MGGGADILSAVSRPLVLPISHKGLNRHLNNNNRQYFWHRPEEAKRVAENMQRLSAVKRAKILLLMVQFS